MTQYENSTPSAIMPYIINHVGVFDEYIAMRTGEYEYSAIVGDYNQDAGTATGTKYVISRSSSYNEYRLSVSEVENETVKISNEYYVYSNDFVGQYYNVNGRYDQTTSAALVFVLGVLLVFSIISGVLSIWKRKMY